MSGRSYVGDIFFGLYDNAGNFTGFLSETANSTTLSFTPPEVESVSRISKKRENPGQTLDEFSEATGTPQMALTTDEAIPEIMGIALLGDVVEVNISAGSAAAEPVTYFLDKWVKLANVNITDGTVSIDDGASGTFVEGTDYLVEPRKGMIKALSSGSMTDATEFATSYDFTAITGHEIVGHTKRNVRARIYGDMEDLATGKRGEIRVPDARFRPTDAIAFIQDQAFLQIPLEGSLVTMPGEPGPFTFREIEA